MSNLSNHLTFLFGEDKGYIYSPIKRKNGEWIQKFYLWPDERTSLTNWIVSESMESDVYLSPAIWKDKKITPESVDHYNVVWIEFDGQNHPDWQNIPEPTYIVQTSVATHQHCYWKLDEPINNVQTVEDVNHRLTYYLGADTSGWDYQQVLRPPDTMNFKHNIVTKVVKNIESTNYKVSSFDAAPNIEKPIETFIYDNLLQVKDIIKDNNLDPELIYKINSEIVLHPHRSEFLMSVGYLLAEAELDPLEIVSCLFEIDNRIKKFVGREDQLRRLSEIASIASFKVERALYVSVYSPKEILNHTLELEWVIPGLLHSTGQMIITGQPGVGKTQLCFDIAYRLCTGLQILGKELTRPYKVVFLSLEMDVTELKYIFAHQANDFKEHGLWNENLYVISPDIDANLGTFEKTLKDINPDVLIIDSVSELATDDLTEKEAREIMRWMKKIRKKYTVGVVAIHHNRKASDANKKPKKLGDLYGSYLFAKATETVLSMWQEEGRDLIELDALKVRFSRKESYRLKRSENLTFSTEANFSVSIGPSTTEPGKTILNFS